MLETNIFEKIGRTHGSDCWLWNGTKNRKGYGMIRSHGTMRSVHRLMRELVTGEVLPRDVHVLHRCDAPACCNPGHLFLGTNAINILDKVQKDRSGKKLKIADVKEVKRMLSNGISQSAIAKQFCVGQPTVSKIKLGKRWAHVNSNESAEAEKASRAV